MQPDDFFYKQVFDGVKSVGFQDVMAKQFADKALVKYKQSTYQGKPFDLIKATVLEAKKSYKLENKGKRK